MYTCIYDVLAESHAMLFIFMPTPSATGYKDGDEAAFLEYGPS
jgi:hypothetical protein